MSWLEDHFDLEAGERHNQAILAAEQKEKDERRETRVNLCGEMLHYIDPSSGTLRTAACTASWPC